MHDLTSPAARAFHACHTTIEDRPMPVTAVGTTGIFCRASCSARPLAEHTLQLPGARDALFAGFRPCRTCHPMATGTDPEWARAAVSLVESAPERPRTGWSLAGEVGVAVEALNRWFERTHRLSAAEYLRARRLTPVLRAARTARRRIPGRGRVVTTMLETPLGPMLAGTTDRGVALLEFADRPMLPTQLRTLERRIGLVVAGSHRHLDRLRDELAEYFAGERTAFDVPLDVPGSDFQERIWAGLRAIPFGATVTYADLAASTGRAGAARAVGRANGSNRVAIVIPCHRVVAAGGGLGGYGGGLDRKQRLLDLEAAAARAGTAPAPTAAGPA